MLKIERRNLRCQVKNGKPLMVTWTNIRSNKILICSLAIASGGLIAICADFFISIIAPLAWRSSYIRIIAAALGSFISGIASGKKGWLTGIIISFIYTLYIVTMLSYQPVHLIDERVTIDWLWQIPTGISIMITGLNCGYLGGLLNQKMLTWTNIRFNQIVICGLAITFGSLISICADFLISYYVIHVFLLNSIIIAVALGSFLSGIASGKNGWITGIIISFIHLIFIVFLLSYPSPHLIPTGILIVIIGLNCGYLGGLLNQKIKIKRKGQVDRKN